MNRDTGFPASERPRGYLKCFLQSSWPRQIRDSMQSAEAACRVLRRMRKRYRLSQSEAAALLGTTAATVQAWEAERRCPSGAARMLIRLTQAAIENWPPGQWREELWGSALSEIVAWRKQETIANRADDALDDFKEWFRRKSVLEKEHVIRDCQALVDWMKSVSAVDSVESLQKPNQKL